MVKQGGIEYRGKLIGTEMVPAPTGDEICLTSLAKLRTALKTAKLNKIRIAIRLTPDMMEIINQESGVCIIIQEY